MRVHVCDRVGVSQSLCAQVQPVQSLKPQQINGERRGEAMLKQLLGLFIFSPLPTGVPPPQPATSVQAGTSGEKVS